LASLIETGEFEMNIKNMISKAPYLAIGLVALELASFPVAAQIMGKAAFSPAQRTVAVPFPPQPGIAKFLVSSNAPFAIVSENAIGEFEVSVKVSGVLNGNRFGENAQMPGPATSCKAQTTLKSTKIYEAERKTEAKEGDVLTRAVIVEIRYEDRMRPNLKIISENKAKKIKAGSACETRPS